MSSQQFIALQKADPALEEVRKAALGHPLTAGVGFLKEMVLSTGDAYLQEELIMMLLVSS